MLSARINARPRHKNAGRPADKKAPGYLQWLRSRSCHLEDKGGCSGKVRACHVDHGGDKGMGTKVADMYAIPMCDRHHSDQHNIGWSTFERLYKFDAVRVAGLFWQAWPGRVMWERIKADRA